MICGQYEDIVVLDHNDIIERTNGTTGTWPPGRRLRNPGRALSSNNATWRVVKYLTAAVTIVAVSYLAGAYSTAFNLFPYPQLLYRPFKAIEARYDRSETLENVYETELWSPARVKTTGVATYHPDRSYRGYTFFPSGHDTSAALIGMRGRVLHEWRLEFREAWPSTPQTDHPAPSSHIYWRRAELFPNGNIITTYTTVADTPYGYGLVKLDKDSEVIWKYSGHAHHDFAVADDGSIYTIAHQFRDKRVNPVDGLPQMPRRELEDSLVRLDPEGREQKRIQLLDLFANSPYRHLVQMYSPGSQNPATPDNSGDLLHTNSVTVVGEKFARHHAFAEPGQLLVSFRPLDAIGLISFEDERITWMTRGFSVAQHDPDPLPNGHILLFDNRGHGGPGGRSRILEFDPSSRRIEWMYTGNSRIPFESWTLGAQQPLPNGNILVTSSKAGRIFEINRSGDIVWDYFNPVRRKHQRTEYTSVLFEATRITPSRLTFTPNALSDG